MNISFLRRCLAGALIITVMLAAGAGSIRAYADVTQAETISVDPTGLSAGYSAVLYDNSNGLPTSEANAIAETSEGFIWIGSYSGLIRYDGNTFERIDSSTGIASVVSLFVDRKDRLWIGTNDSGAYVMEKGSFTSYNRRDGLKSLSVRSITGDEQGNVYLATTQGIAVIDGNGELSFIDDSRIADEYICELRPGAGNILYGVTKGGAVFSIENRSLKLFLNTGELGLSDARCILPDANEPRKLFIGSTGSAVYSGVMTDTAFELTGIVDTGSITSINSLEQLGDTLWLCADTGIGFIRDGKVSPLENMPITTSAEKLTVDYLGDLWFVSSQQGVMKIVPNRFEDIFNKYRLESEVVYTTCMYNDTLFVGTKTKGLIALKDGKQVSSIPIDLLIIGGEQREPEADLISMLSGARIRSIVRDSRNRLWFSTYSDRGLLRYDNGEVREFHASDGLPSDRVRVVYECADGSFMVCCSGGLAIIKDDAVVRVYGENDGIENLEILTASQLGNGDMVIGTDGSGIYVISGDTVKHISTDEGLSSDIVMRLKRDAAKDILWIVTSNAVGYMDAAHNVRMIRNFPYPNNFDLYENSKGDVWVLGSNGIYTANAEQLLAGGEISTIHYGSENGLPCIAAANSYSELTPDGDLYISGTTGIAKVNIEKPAGNVSDFKMAVPVIDADGVSVYPDGDGAFVIPASAEKITIYSYIYNYTLMDPQVSFYMDGLDKQTVTVKRSELIPISYSRIPGGKYTFVMNVQDPDGSSGREMRVVIDKQYAFHELLWVRVLAAVLILVLLGVIVQLYIRVRTRRFEKKEQEQKQLIREIVEAFAKVIDMKDKYTNGHSSRVAEYTAMLARELGYDEDTVERYYNIAMMHDIGKVAVPAEVLNKPGKLTDEEFEIIKSHAKQGYEALKGISIMPELAVGAGAHHERPDGKGYPNGLKGDEIPRVAQIIAVADTFDAMYSNRPYRKRMNFKKVVSIITEVRGTQLTEDVVDAFLRLVEKGKFRDPEDDGGGTTEDINNIRKSFDEQKQPAESPKEPAAQAK